MNEPTVDLSSREYTPTERRILAVLADGQPHGKAELHKCLEDDLSKPESVRTHIHRLRPKLRRFGQDILGEYRNRACFYRQIRLLASAVNGYH